MAENYDVWFSKNVNDIVIYLFFSIMIVNLTFTYVGILFENNNNNNY